MENYIVHHEQSQPYISYFGFVQESFRRIGFGRIPPLINVQGQVIALINQGRWLVNCPAGCRSALIVTDRTPLFVCVGCGSPENGNNWYEVIFPSNKTAIEAVLLKRPEVRPEHATTRSWVPGETVADLKRENREHGWPEE